MQSSQDNGLTTDCTVRTETTQQHMPARQVYQILDAIQDVHRHPANRYRELEEVATDARIQSLLEHMEQRERTFDDCVAEYESEEKPKVLETRLQFVPDEATHIDHVAERLRLQQSLEDLVDETLRLNSTLIDAYLTLAKETAISELGELFTNLAKIDERNDCHYVKMPLDA